MIKFQAIDWRYTNNYKKNNKYESDIIIQIFGKTTENKNIYVEIINFKPYFYINDFVDCEKIIKSLIKLITYETSNFIISKPFEAKNFYGFCGNKTQLFRKISCSNYIWLKRLSNYCLDNFKYKTQSKTIKDIYRNYKGGLKVFEANKDVIIQYLHERNLKSCGWIQINKYNELEIDEDNENNTRETNAEINIQVEWNQVNYLEGKENNIASFTLCAYDLEVVSSDDRFPVATRKDDKIVSIASTFSKINEECYYKNIIILGKCPDIEGIDVICCNTEKELIITWCKMIREQDPDITTTWNGFGFDDNYLYDRAKLLKIYDQIMLSRITNKETEFVTKQLSSAALGNNIMKYYDMIGRINFDLMKLVQREHKLESYKLDYVASKFFREQVKSIKYENKKTIIETNTKEFHNNQYIIFIRNDGITDYECFDNNKFQVNIIDKNHLLINGIIDNAILKEKGRIYCCNVKDDIKPKEIFEKFRSGDPENLKELSLYNIQDCELCNKLCNKLCVLINNIGMANVCCVPLNWIFNRGQSPKIFSLVSQKCREKGYLIPTRAKIIKNDNDNNNKKVTYEGAKVIKPIPGIYPAIFCLDYAALYPRSMICKNISHETYVMDEKIMEEYKDEYNFDKVEYLPLDMEIVEANKKKNQSENDYKSIKYFTVDNYNKNMKQKTCYFAKNKDKTKIGLIPEIFMFLLDSRANVRKLQKSEKDEFKWQVLDGLQLAYKVTCNSVYGQFGCDENIGPLSLVDLAACTTATGREMLETAKYFAEEIYPKIIKLALTNIAEYKKYMNKILINLKENKEEFINNIKTKLREILLVKKNGKLQKKYLYNFQVIYGDTDSIMVNINLLNYNTKQIIYGFELRDVNIKFGQIASKIICQMLPYPEQLEYEKILSPFMIMSKKRYVGNLYENDPNKFYQKNMGLVLKRRDNAPIVKYVVGGIVERLFDESVSQEQAKQNTLEFAKLTLNEIINGKFNINLFIFTKTLNSEYKNRNQIAHAVLADRIAKRDPGNKPLSNERIRFAYVNVDESKVKLQGDRIETPEYIKENNLSIDYGFYISNQIKKPSLQILNLIDDKCDKIFLNILEQNEYKKYGIQTNNLSLFLEKNNNYKGIILQF